MIREILTLDALQKLDADEAAALLLVRQDAGDDGHDEAVFDEWLFADPANAEAWVRACNAWTALDNADAAHLAELRVVAPAEPRARPRWSFAIAASVAVVAAVGGAMLLDRGGGPGGSTDTQLAGAEPGMMLATAKGEHRSFQLADASTVTLNTDSRVAVAFRVGERRLELMRGQAYFQVAHDKTRPFVVAVDGRTVTALGTKFEVRADLASVRVVLIEGKVAVTRIGGPPVVMRPGQQLVASPRGVSVSAADVSAVNDWQRGIVTFKDTTLAAAAAELNRYSRAQLEVDDPRIAGLTVSGVFQTSDARRFARTIAQIHPVRIEADGGDTLRIVPATAGRG